MNPVRPRNMYSKRDINEYLFYEFGIDAAGAQISDTWPFELRDAGVIVVDEETLEVFEFTEGDDTYFAVAGDALNFYPSWGMTIDDLRLQISGARWIGQREPIDLNTSRIGDESVPPTVTRREAIREIALRALGNGSNIRILEGLFLRRDGTYLALVEDTSSGEAYVVGSGIDPHPARFPDASKWRRLAVAVGELLRDQKLLLS